MKGLKPIISTRLSLLQLKYCIFVLFCAILFVLSVFHEPWYDEYHVYLMCEQLSLRELIDSMLQEGHFVFWHFLIYPFAKFGFGLYSLEICSCSLTCVAAWLLLFKSPFSLSQINCVLWSYPVLYMMPIVSRCYALILPILFCIAYLYRELPKHKYWYAFFVGLLAHTHAYMEGLVGALFLLYLYEYVLKGITVSKQISIKNIGAAIIMVLIVLGAYFQVRGSLSYSQTEEFCGFTQTSGALFEDLMESNGFCILAFARRYLGIAYHIYEFDHIATLILWFFALGFIFNIMWTNENKKWLFVMITSIGWQFFSQLTFGI